MELPRLVVTIDTAGRKRSGGEALQPPLRSVRAGPWVLQAVAILRLGVGRIDQRHAAL
jgi:hypothetical protein